MTTTSIYTAHATTRLGIEECYRCGMVFGVPAGFQRAREDDCAVFYCPNGHPQHYTESTEEILRADLEQTRDALAASRASLAATKGHLTRTRKRLAAGVCPYCHRNFVALGKHIRGQHPGECEEDA